jgi:hypothetical protein
MESVVAVMQEAIASLGKPVYPLERKVRRHDVEVDLVPQPFAVRA